MKMKDGALKTKNPGLRRGSIFTAMLAAVIAIGLLGTSIYSRMVGPVSTMARLDARMTAEEHIINSGRAVIRAAADCDSDAHKEAPQFVTGTGPAGGGIMPTTLGLHTTDPWGTKYGYCAWDIGATSDDAACSGPGAKRLDGTNDPSAGYASTTTSFALVSAGPDRVFQTTCAAYSNGTTAVLAPGGDDLVESYTSQDVASGGGGSGSPIWSLKGGDPTTGTISKHVEVQGSVFKVDYLTGDLTIDDLNVTPGKYIATGGLLKIAGPASFANGTIQYFNSAFANGDTPQVLVAFVWKNFGYSLPNAVSPWTQGGGGYLYGSGNLIVSEPPSGHTAQDLAAQNPPATADTVFMFNPARGAFRAGTTNVAAAYNDANAGLYSFGFGTRVESDSYACFASGGSPSTPSLECKGGVWATGDSVHILGPNSTGNIAHGDGIDMANWAHNMIFMGKNLDYITAKASCTIDVDCSQNNIVLGESITINDTSAAQRVYRNVILGHGNGSTISGNTNHNVIVYNAATVNLTTRANSLIFPGGAGRALGFNTATIGGGELFDLTGTAIKNGGTTWTAFASDIRQKTVSRPYERGLDDVIRLQPVVFSYKKDNPYNYSPDTTYIGYIAQDVQKVFPECVGDNDEDGYLELDTNPIEAALVNAAKDMATLQDNSADDLAKMEARLDAIAARIGVPGTSWRNDIQWPAVPLTISLLVPLALIAQRRRKKP